MADKQPNVPVMPEEIAQRYEVLHKLGAQSQRKFNGVFLVRHRETGVLGVYKQVVKTYRNEHLCPLLRQEAAISFAETGLPHTLDFVENAQEIVLVRNYQPGIPLDEYWKTVPRSSRQSFLTALTKKLACLFDIIEKEGIVHCDLKPSNIIVNHENQELEVSLIDFGMAVRKGQPAERQTLFALGYSAPELILNKLEIVDQTTDIFALGVSIWQLFTGKLPLTHANPGIMTNLQITHPLPEHSAVPKAFRPVLARMCLKHSFQLPPNLMSDADVEKCLQEAMEKRYRNLHEVAVALQQHKKSGFIRRLFGR